MEDIKVKKVLKINEDKEWNFVDYDLDVYVGCDHGCIYCSSRSSRYRINNFDKVRIKKDFLMILDKELRYKKKKGIISIGNLSDPYCSIEKDLQLTRQALQIIHHYGFGVVIHTKSDLVCRDFDLLKQIQEHSIVIIDVSISSSNDKLSMKIEPQASLSSQRFKIVNQCYQNSLICGISLKPVLPYISDDINDLQELIEKAYQNKSTYLISDMKVTLRDHQKNYYYQKIDEYFNGLSYQYKRIYNNRYHCETLKWKENYNYLKNKCIEYSIYYQMEQMNQFVQNKKEKYQQISLFE